MIKENPYRTTTNSEADLDFGDVLICAGPATEAASEPKQKRKKHPGNAETVADMPQPSASVGIKSEMETEETDPAQMLVLPRHQDRYASQFDNRLGCIGALVVFMFVAYCLM